MVKDSIELKINGNIVDISEILNVSFQDNAGTTSDRVTIKVIPTFKKPAVSDKIELIFISSKNILNCGFFHVQSVERVDNKDLSFTGTGVEFNYKQKEKKSFHYKDTKLSEIVKIIGKRLNHNVRFKATDVLIKSLNQTNESDIFFLERLAKEYNCLFSIKNDFIYFVNKDDKTLPVTTINVNNCSSSSIKHSSKTFYNSCEAFWRDIDENKDVFVKVGEGRPILKIKKAFANKEDAEAKAKAKLQDVNKGIVKGSLSLKGTNIYAGTKIQLINTYGSEDDHIFSVEQVSHRWNHNSGWITNIEIEN